MTQWDKISTGVSRNPWTPTVKISSHRADFSYFCAFEFFRLNVDHVLRRFILDLREPIMGLRGGILGRRVDLGLFNSDFSTKRARFGPEKPQEVFMYVRTYREKEIHPCVPGSDHSIYFRQS